MIEYDFSSSAAQSFAENQVEAAPGVFALFSGDMSSVASGVQDGYVDLFDLTEVHNKVLAAVSGYVNEDLNGDAYVDLTDLTMVYNNAYNSVGMKTPPNP